MAPSQVTAERDGVRAFEGRPLRLGSIVSVGVNGTCGKLLADNGEVVRIAYLRDGGKLEERRHSRAEIEPALLPAQTRVWVQRDDRTWRDGRIRRAHRLPDGGFEYEVNFPSRGTVDVDEIDLYVRAQDRLLDPATILAAQNFDPLRFYRARAAFLDRLAEMRLSCEGLSGYISAGIEIVRHQLAAVRRVLRDPVQRYLLADEVGLGKTIEAGAIIRQCLIDDPMRNVLVGVPALMVPQWRRELCDRFGLSPDRDGVTILSYDDLPGEVDEPYDLFVVDEAHHVTGVQASPIAEAVAELGRRTPRLLLLSATPALADPASFLGLLHLLDPEAHPLDLEAFQVKLNRTEALGAPLRKLRGNATAFLLKSAAKDFANLLADDAEVSSLTGRLLEVIDDNETQRRADAVGALRQYVAETYRVHQRLVRSRRREAQGWEFQDRGPKIEEGRVSLEHVRTEVDPDPRVEDLVAELEEWRYAACAALGDCRDAPVFRLAVARWEAFVTALGEDIQCFVRALARLEQCFEGEGAHLDSLRRALHGSHASVPPRAELALMSAARLRKVIGRPSGCKIVLYAGTVMRAATLYAEGRRRFGPDSTVDLQATPDISQLQSDRGRWADAWLIVAGPSHEEGLNLQFADAIVHADLPWSVGRMEQRIGRIDRFGRRGGQIRQRILLPSDLDGTPWAAWYHLLAQGFGIFNESVSDVQFLLADLEQEIRIASFTGGGVAVETMIPLVRSRLLEARARFDDQYAIDRVVMEEEPVEALQEEIDALDERQQEFEQAAEVLIEEVLQFQHVCLVENGADPFKLHWTNRVQISNEWKETFKPSLDRALTWRRETAIRRPNTVLLRPGAALLDALCGFLEEDDRGRVFGLWRTAPSFKGEPRLAFVLRWQIVAEIDPGWIRDDAMDVAALDRRLATLAPPWNRTQYLDADMNPVADPDLLAVLADPGAADICLARRRDLLAGLVDEVTLARSCRRARSRAEEALRADEEFCRAWDERVQRVRSDVADRRRRLTARGAVLARAGAVDPTIARELQGESLLERAMNDPLIVLDAMGVVVIAGATPGGLGLGRMP